MNSTENNSSLSVIHPLPFTPYPFQLEDIKTISQYHRILIGHDMGLGKTFICIMIGNSIPLRKLVIVPESLRLNWLQEIKRILPNADVKILYSKDDMRRFVYGEDWTIVGYSTAVKHQPYLAEFQCVFVDEAHRCKAVNNWGKPASKRAEAVMRIVMNAEYCYLTSGTPIPTRNKDLYNILRMLAIDEIDFSADRAFYNYGMHFCAGYKTNWGHNFDGNSNSLELHEILMKHMVRRRKQDVLSGLHKTRSFIPFAIGNNEIRNIHRRIRESKDMNEFLGLAMTGRRLMSMQKIPDCTDFVSSILEGNDSVVIVTEFINTIEALSNYYGLQCCMITGGMSDEEKQTAVQEFQSGQKKVCLLSLLAGGLGLTLTRANKMVILDFDWTPANMLQVEDRICRIGQDTACNIYYLYGVDCYLDSYFVEMLTTKEANIDTVVDHTSNQLDLREDRNASTSFIAYLKDKLGISF